MKKAYIVVKAEMGKLGPDIVAAFANEGEAEHSSASYRSDTVKSWVEEVNYYE